MRIILHQPPGELLAGAYAEVAIDLHEDPDCQPRRQDPLFDFVQTSHTDSEQCCHFRFG